MSPRAKQLFATNDALMMNVESIFADCPWNDPKYYASWCGQTYYFVCHSTRLLGAAAARLQIDRDALHVRFLDHCQEEKHHEKLLVKDMQHLGVDVKDVPELPITAQLYQSQYYLIEHRDPLALFGNILYMEGMSIHCGAKVYPKLREMHGEKACNFLRVHVTEDDDHMEKAQKALGALSDSQIELIEWSLRQTSSIYETMLVEILKVHGARGSKAA